MAKDGLNPNCKSCVRSKRQSPEYKEKVATRYRTPEARERQRIRNARPEYIAYRRAYDQSEYAKNKAREREQRPEYKATNRDYWLRRKYGITLSAYEEMLKKQNGRCALCSSAEPGGSGSFKVDHDHSTGTIRGLLCFSCNVLLGHADDSPERLRDAASYIEENRSK